MRLPVRPLRLIHEFCAFREVAYSRKGTSWAANNPSVFHVASVRYELVTESGVIVVSSLRRAFPDQVIVLEPPPYRIGKVDDDHAVCLVNHGGVSMASVYRIVWKWKHGHSLPPRISWELVSSVTGSGSQRWDIYSAHRLGISIMYKGVTPDGLYSCRLLDWDWANDTVVKNYAPIRTDSRILDMIHGYGYISSLCQIRNTRFLAGRELELRICEGEPPLASGHRMMEFCYAGHIIPRSFYPWATTSRSIIHGTAHILEGNSRRTGDLYVMTMMSIGFAVLDPVECTLRLFRLSEIVALAEKQFPMSPNRNAQIQAQYFLGKRVWWLAWSGNREHASRCQAILPIEIDGGQDWIRLAIFHNHNSCNYVVDLDLRTWTPTLVGFFALADKLDIVVGLVEWNDPNVDILRELTL